MGHDKNDVRFASVLPRLIAVGGIALAVTAAIVWGAVRLVHEGPAVDLVSGRWALAGVTECTPDNTVMQVSGIDVALFARNAQLDANIVWVARVRDELRMDMEPRGLNGSVFALGFR